MFGPNQGMGRKFVILTCSNYLLYKKIGGRWDELLKPHYFSFNHSSFMIWILLGLQKNCKQYEVMINDYTACNCVDFKQGSWVQCKHSYYILQFFVFSRIRKPFIHYSLIGISNIGLKEKKIEVARHTIEAQE
jgi:hypothetical protein